jgi:transposase
MTMNTRPITKNDREDLLALAADPDPVTMRRARVMLMIMEGEALGAVVQAWGVSERTIRGIVSMFNEDGVARLRRRSPSGRPKSISHEQRQGLIELLRRAPEEFGLAVACWSPAQLATIARREGALGKISATTLHRELMHITQLSPELEARLVLPDPPRPGAPPGNQNARRHGAYVRSAPSDEERGVLVEIEARFRHDFPDAGRDEAMRIRAVANACLMLQRALSADCVEAAVRADRRVRKALQALKSVKPSPGPSSRAELTQAEWAADLVARYRIAEKKSNG